MRQEACNFHMEMKKNLHPVYRDVVYQDITTGWTIVTRSTAETDETITLEDGRTYPVIKIDLSSSSHPFFTGKERVADTEGRIARFRKKYEKKSA